ncbi:MAG: phosphoglycerate mutase family protein [Bacteriovoracia bacterium]
MNKQLILLRHGHRQKISFDNGLSEKGQKQAKAISKFFSHRFSEKPMLVSSPKKRCLETLDPLSKEYKREIEILAFLDEGGALEDKAIGFRKWIETEAPDLVVACSHGDVLPTIIQNLTGARVDLKKGSWTHILIHHSGNRLFELIQKL